MTEYLCVRLLQTDVSHTKQMMIYVFYVNVEQQHKITAEFFALIQCPDGTAKGITLTLLSHIQSFEDAEHGQWLWRKWVAFGTDGPSVMTGKQGVHGQIRAFKSYLVGVHCVGHRTALAANDTFSHKSVPFCANLDEFLRALGRFYSWSTERRVELKALAHDNEEPETEVSMACATRWLSRDRACTSVLDKYVTVTEQHYNGMASNSTSLGLFKKLTDYKYFAGLAAVADILAAQAALSRTFQAHVLDGFTVRKGVDDFKAGMLKYTSAPEENPHFGPNLQHLVDNIGDKYCGASVQDFLLGGHGFEVSFSSTKRDFIEGFTVNLAKAAMERMEERFPDVPLLQAFDIFDVRRLPEGAPDDYGHAEITLLHDHFKQLVQVPVDVALTEWSSFLVELRKRPTTESFQSTYSFFKGRHGLESRMQSVSHMTVVLCNCSPCNRRHRIVTALSRVLSHQVQSYLDIKAILVFASVVCEFGFSAMKEAKKERQSAMDTLQLDARLRIHLLGPKDPNSWPTEQKADKALFDVARKTYMETVSSIVNASIEAWNGKRDHNSKKVSRVVSLLSHPADVDRLLATHRAFATLKTQRATWV